MMKTNVPDLNQFYKTMLAEQLAAEKKYMKLFNQLTRLIHTDEIRLAISPAETDIESHISRLSRAMKAAKHKVAAPLSGIDSELLKTLKASAGKGSSLLKDVEMIGTLKLIYSAKVSRYDSLYRMATVLLHEEYAGLLEQCSKDNQNTYAYLNQIAQNVLYPELSKPEASKP